MNKPEAIIFDMDGCLYPLDRGSGKSFSESKLGQMIKANELIFIQEHFAVSEKEARIISENLNDHYDGHLSLALEYEHGIPRETFFSKAWDLRPAEFIDRQPHLPKTLENLSIRAGLLTAAPEVWAARVLDHLSVQPFFGTHILYGDQDVRKPNPQAFQQIADMLGVDPRSIISIGDQEYSDIVPAQTLGMLTVRIGANTASSNADFLAEDIYDAIHQLTEAGLL